MNFSAVILAGGQSRRMGSDKAWLTVEGKPLIARQVELVRQAGAEEVFISGHAGTDYSSLNCRVVLDRIAEAGPLGGIESALAASNTPLTLVLAVDLPKMTVPVLQMLVAKCQTNCGVVPRFNEHLEPLAAIYPRSAREIAKEQLDNGCFAARDFAARCVDLRLAIFQELTSEEAIHFQNWNSPADIRI